MSLKIFLIGSLGMLVLGAFFGVRERRSSRLPVWREVLVLFGTIALAVSVLTFTRFLSDVQGAESRNETVQISALIPLVRVGFWCASGAFVLAFFSSEKSRSFFLYLAC